MAGEIEEPFSFNFQEGSIHSGSISFGRFENEGLSWERRSAFSHNRYVEEVEKCMKPGSVIERKAYFEAHFKKRGFPKPNLDECYSGTCYQAGENGVPESNDPYREECDETGSEGSSYAESDDQRSEKSVSLGDFEVIECEKEEDPEVSLSDPQREPALNHIAILVDGAVEDVNFEEAQQPEKGFENYSFIVEEVERDVNENHIGDAVIAESKAVNICSQTEPDECVDKTVMESERSTSSKAVKESKSVRPEPSISQVKKSISAKSSGKHPIENSNTSQRERRTDKEKLPSKTAMPTTHSVPRTLNSEDSMKGKSLNESKRDKETSKKKVGEPQPSAYKSESRGRQMTYSSCRISNRSTSTNSDARSSVTTFNFRSSERAEQRKEFFMKLERKMQAKEDEMNKVQARKQERTEAEMKQLRKSLNFKAAPMPSFYNVAKAPRPEESKSVSTKSSKLEKRRGNAAAARLRSPSESGKSATRETKCTKAATFVTKTEVSTVQRSRTLESRTVAKNVVKQKVGAGRNGREVMKKTTVKGAAFGSSSRMTHHLAVGVAS